MPAQFSGGASKQHRLPNQDEIDAAAQVLAQRGPQPYMKGVPTPLAPITEQPLAVPPPSAVGEQLYGHGEPEEAPKRHDGQYSIFYVGEDVHVTLWIGGDAYTGAGASVVEALSVAAGKLEEGLEAPRCATCGQVLPEQLRDA